MSGRSAGPPSERAPVSYSTMGAASPAAPTMDWQAVRECLACYDSGATPDRPTEKRAVKSVLGVLAAVAPGRSVEVRVPPHAAVQVVAGPSHRRGTPPALVQMAGTTLLALAVGRITWADATDNGSIRASGERCDLSRYFPMAGPGEWDR